MTVPRLVVGAPASGSGKTMVATGLMTALAARGLAVSPHKVGPDYIDPGYHARATGRPGRNLDPWLVGTELVEPLFLHGADGADVAVVEGVMGLFDGAAGRGGFASTAHVAALLRAPVVLVVDAASAGRSVAALVHGFATYRPASSDGPPPHVAGVILNRVGSDRHEEICRSAVADTGVPVLGALRRRDDIATPARHLGLVPAAERAAEALDTVRRLGAMVGEACDLDALLALARGAPALTARPWSAGHGPRDHEASAAGCDLAGDAVVAVADGAAFTFGYRENIESLTAAGAEVVPFDPLRDEALPAGTNGLVIGGGFPETYAAGLSANERLREEIAAFVRSGAPTYAECAGLLYLTKALDGAPMAGVIDAVAHMSPRLTLGYREAVAVADTLVARAGERVRGHEFHRTAIRPGHGATPAWQWSAEGPEGFASAKCVASYLHLHWAGTPQVARRLVEACRGRRR